MVKRHSCLLLAAIYLNLMLPLLLIYLLLDIFAELKAKEKGAKALFTFLPFYLFTFINSLAACLQSSAAISLPALPAAHAYTR